MLCSQIFVIHVRPSVSLATTYLPTAIQIKRDNGRSNKTLVMVNYRIWCAQLWIKVLRRYHKKSCLSNTFERYLSGACIPQMNGMVTHRSDKAATGWICTHLSVVSIFPLGTSPPSPWLFMDGNQAKSYTASPSLTPNWQLNAWDSTMGPVNIDYYMVFS